MHGATRKSWQGNRWTLTSTGDGVVLKSAGAFEAFQGPDVELLIVERQLWRWTVRIRSSPQRRLKGLRKRDAISLRVVLSQLREEQRRVERARQLARRIQQLEPAISEAERWQARVDNMIATGLQTQRWISSELVHALETARPDPGLRRLVMSSPELAAQLSPEQHTAVAFSSTDLGAAVRATNEEIVERELVSRKDFLDKIEESPLTDQQARVVLTFDNRVHVVAAAGSGKTSVMVARAAYAIERGFVSADRILLLAFNKDAAEQLQHRVERRLGAAGIDAQGLQASTFHAFGLWLIGMATGRKPRLADWLGSPQQESQMIERIVDDLRDASQDFRFKWDLFRLLFARVSESPDAGDPDSYDPASRIAGFRTFAGETVRSQGERMIADWLYINGVDYEYERPYEHDTRDATHGQYRPDFYYPRIDVWHEHWAIGHDGRPPESFAGYEQSMRWKRQVHSQFGTRLLETTWAGMLEQEGFTKLAEQLTRLGITLDWNPDREVVGGKQLEHADLCRLIRTFMSHVKSGSHTRESLDERLAGDRGRLATYRTSLFLDLYWQIHAEWQSRLAAAQAVDFEDMLVSAAAHLEAGDISAHFDLIMVDEFQDASQARARLVRALLRDPGKYLLAVGDDWQSINRFAGADISVLTDFHRLFGGGDTLRLETTFRCPQSLCDVASLFVQKNPRQIRKSVRSAHAGLGAAVTIIRAEAPGAIQGALASHLQDIASNAGREPGRKISVDVLGRYGFDRDVMPRRAPSGLEVTFRTAHAAKGLEADYIVIPRMLSGVYGFPSEIVDDPLLDLVMAEADSYPHAEERRLFYVAMTRARRGLTLITAKGNESPFVLELLKDGLVTSRDVGGLPDSVRICPTCGEGSLVRRNGPYGEFFGCSRFPRCRATAKL